LLYGVIFALPFIGLRTVYAVCTVFVTSPGFSSSLAAKVCLSVVPEMIVTLGFIVVGVATRDIKASARNAVAV